MGVVQAMLPPLLYFLSGAAAGAAAAAFWLAPRSQASPRGSADVPAEKLAGLFGGAQESLSSDKLDRLVSMASISRQPSLSAAGAPSR